MVEESKPTRSDPSPGPGSGGPTDREEAKVVTAAQSSSGDEDYEAEPEVKVSEEALRGPKGPAPVPEYEFEKNIDANGEIKASEFCPRVSWALGLGLTGWTRKVTMNKPAAAAEREITITILMARISRGVCPS